MLLLSVRRIPYHTTGECEYDAIIFLSTLTAKLGPLNKYLTCIACAAIVLATRKINHVELSADGAPCLLKDSHFHH